MSWDISKCMNVIGPDVSECCSKLDIKFDTIGTMEGSLVGGNVYEFHNTEQQLGFSPLILYSTDNGMRWDVSNFSLKCFNISFL